MTAVFVILSQTQNDKKARPLSLSLRGETTMSAEPFVSVKSSRGQR